LPWTSCVERHALIAIGIDLAAIEALFGDGIGEKIERCGRALEALFGGLIAWADVRVQLLGKRPVGAANIVGASGSADAEGGIWIPAQGVSALRLRTPAPKSESDASGHSGLPDYNVMVNSLFKPVAPLSPFCATRMCNDPGKAPKSAVCAAAVSTKLGTEVVSLRIGSPKSRTSTR